MYGKEQQLRFRGMVNSEGRLYVPLFYLTLLRESCWFNFSTVIVRESSYTTFLCSLWACSGDRFLHQNVYELKW